MSTKQLARTICIVVAVALVWVVLPLVLESGATASRHLAGEAAAQAERRAALVAQFGDGSYVTRCVSFSEETITGLDLLIRSGLQASLWGGAVCRIEQQGCDYPAETCFCQCKGSSCQYWSYWHLRDGAWTYAQIGSGDYRVGDGDAEAWLWGDAQTPPLAISFADICGPSGSDTTEVVPTKTAAAPAQESSQSVPLAQYAVFAVMAVALVAGFWFVRGRQRG